MAPFKKELSERIDDLEGKIASLEKKLDTVISTIGRVTQMQGNASQIVADLSNQLVNIKDIVKKMDAKLKDTVASVRASTYE